MCVHMGLRASFSFSLEHTQTLGSGMCQYITSDHVDLYMEESPVSDLQFAFHQMIVYHGRVCSTVAYVSLRALISSIDFFWFSVSKYR